MGEKIRLVIDAMGGDYAPKEVVTGAVQGAREHDVRITLVGDPIAIQHELSELNTEGLSFDVIDAPEVIRMDESPVKAVRLRPEATINVACRMVTQGQADGVLTMGHSGAGLIAGMFNFGLIRVQLMLNTSQGSQTRVLVCSPMVPNPIKATA
jgi:glycerol-3-phosphate acyltransferase PlsX